MSPQTKIRQSDDLAASADRNPHPLKVLHSALVIHRILFLQVGEGMANTVRLQ